MKVGNEIDPRVTSTLELAREVRDLRKESRTGRRAPIIMAAVVILLLVLDITQRYVQDQHAVRDRQTITRILRIVESNTSYEAREENEQRVRGYLEFIVNNINEHIDRVHGIR